MFENHKLDHATPLLKARNGIPSSTIKSQLLSSARPGLSCLSSLFLLFHSTNFAPTQGLCTCCPCPGWHVPSYGLACSLDSSLESNVTTPNKAPWPPCQREDPLALTLLTSLHKPCHGSKLCHPFLIFAYLSLPPGCQGQEGEHLTSTSAAHPPSRTNTRHTLATWR